MHKKSIDFKNTIEKNLQTIDTRLRNKSSSMNTFLLIELLIDCMHAFVNRKPIVLMVTTLSFADINQTKSSIIAIL
jgi:hypothetical protein